LRINAVPTPLGYLCRACYAGGSWPHTRYVLNEPSFVIETGLNDQKSRVELMCAERGLHQSLAPQNLK